MNHVAIRLMWVFLAAPWLTWVIFHPLADARLGFLLVARPREAGTAVMEALHNAYDVPPVSFIFDAMRVSEETRNERHLHPHLHLHGARAGKNFRPRYSRNAVRSNGAP